MNRKSIQSSIVLGVFLLCCAVLFTSGCSGDGPTNPNDDQTTTTTGTGDTGGTGGTTGGTNPPPPPPPPPPTTKNVQFTINPFCQCPDWFRNGADNDFYGHGPAVTFDARLEVASDRRGVDLRIHFNLKETQADYTTGTLSTVYPNIYRAPSGWKVDAILSATSTSAAYTDNNKSIDLPGLHGNLLYKLEINGDTNGPDLGNCTGDDSYFCAYFNTTTVRLVKE